MSDSKSSQEALGSLGRPAFYILLALADRERHGYGIILEIESQTDGKVRIGTSTLYTSLQRLLKRGFIEDCQSPSPDREDERRRYYRLTPAGRRALRLEAAQLEDLARMVRDKRILPETA